MKKCPNCNSTRFKKISFDGKGNVVQKGKRCYRCGYINYKEYNKEIDKYGKDNIV